MHSGLLLDLVEELGGVRHGEVVLGGGAGSVWRVGLVVSKMIVLAFGVVAAGV